MIVGPAYTTALTYVPLRHVGNLPALITKLTVSYMTRDEEQSLEDDYGAEGEAERLGLDEYETVKCYDLSVRGYIGVPRAFARQEFPTINPVDRTVHAPKRPDLFTSKIKPRDEAQAQFWREIRQALEQPGWHDIVANATTGAGKTVTALWLGQEVVQGPILVTVPTNFLRNQWVSRVREMMGAAWAKQYVGHIQQDIMDYEGRLITIALAPSLAYRNYPIALRRYHTMMVIDEWHKIGAPKMSRILHKYPVRSRLGLTATNRRDALLKVCTFHLGKPRVISTQKVMQPTVFLEEYKKVLPKGVGEPSEFYITTLLSRFHDRNEKLVDIIYNKGWLRDRHVVGLSDRTDQLIEIRRMLMERGVPDINVGILCGTYTRSMFSEKAGRFVNVKYKMSDEEKDDIAGTCNIILTTWGQFDTGSDVDRLDMGVELTPRSNLRQGVGRVLRLLKGKATPEWYGLNDRISYYKKEGANLFADPRPIMYDKLSEMEQARMASYRFHKAIVQTVG